MNLESLGIDPKWAESLQAVFDKYNINTALRKASFIGQCQHESNNFRVLEENLHYSADGLCLLYTSPSPRD